MKKITEFIISAFLVLLLLFSFGCGGLPESDENKISFALNKVKDFLSTERTFTENTNEDTNVKKIKRYLSQKENTEPFNLDKTSSPIPEFYFLLNAYERLEDDLIGTTYYYTFTSSIGFDFDNYTVSNEKIHTHGYEATALVTTNIDESGKIFGELGIKYYYDKDTLNEKRQSIYSAYSLTCDYESFDNTFDMIFHTVIVNAEIDSEFGYNTYSYTRLNVKNGQVLTFQNFYITSPAEVFISDTYPVSYYLDSDEFEFVVGARILEKDGVYYSEHTDPVAEEEFSYTQIKRALFNLIAVDFNANSHDNNYYDFFTSLSSAVKSKSVYRAYNDTTDQIGKDMCYTALPSRYFDYGDIPCEVLSITVANADGETKNSFVLTEDMSISSFDLSGEYGLYYVYFGNVIEKADLSSVNVYCAYKDNGVLSEFTIINPSTLLSKAYVITGAYETPILTLKYELKDNPEITVQAEIDLGYIFDTVEKNWPEQFIKNALNNVELPIHTNPTSSFVYLKSSNGIDLYVLTANYLNDAQDYKQLLLGNGFNLDNGKYVKVNEQTKETLTVTVMTSNDDEEIMRNCFRIRVTVTPNI